MAPNQDPKTDSPESKPAQQSPSKVFGLLIAQLRLAAELMATAVKGLDAKAMPTTLQAYRWLGGAFAENEKRVQALADATCFPPEETTVGMLFEQIPFLLGDAEKRVIDACVAMKLDELPPGNPGEKAFEEKLGPLIKVNKVYAETLHNLAVLKDALASKGYSLSITEEERVTEWRSQRRLGLEKTRDNTRQQLKEARDYLDQIEAALVKIDEALANNDQMTFEEVEPKKEAEGGPAAAPVEESSVVDEGAPKS